MSDSNSDSPESSVQSSPNAPCRLLPLHLLRTLPATAIPTISDSESDDDQSCQVPPSYYVSPRRPEKRRHLSIPSPRMARLSIQGIRFKPSIPGYGEATKKTIRVSASTSNRSGSTSTTGSLESGTSILRKGPMPVSDVAFVQERPSVRQGMQRPIRTSQVALASANRSDVLETQGNIAGTSARPVPDRLIQRLFDQKPGHVGQTLP